MAEAKDEQEWGRTAAMLAMIRNVQAKDRNDMVSPEQLNPYTAAQRKRNTIKDFVVMMKNKSKTVDVKTHG